MSRRNAGSWLVVVFVGAITSGCMPKMTLDQMRASMPKRPAELDRLTVLAGKWSFEGQAKFAMLDEPVKMTGTTEYEWQGDRWYLVGRSVMKMADFDECKSLETWSYDTKAKKYRSFWADTMGMSGIAECTYDEKNRTWAWSATSYGPWGQSSISGTMCMKDDNTVEWRMVESQGWMKVMEMTGTSKRTP